MRRNLFHCSNSQQGATDKVTLLFGITIFFKFLLFDFIWSIPTTFASFSTIEFYATKIIATLVLLVPYKFFRLWKTEIVIMLLLDILLIVNLMYFRTYYTAIPLNSYGLSGNLADFTGSVYDSFRWYDIFFPLSTIASIPLYWHYKRNTAGRTSYKYYGGALGIGILLFWNAPLRRYLQEYYALYFLGLFLNTALVAVLLLVMLSPGVIRGLFYRADNLFVRLRIWKPSGVRQEKMDRFLSGYQGTVHFLKGNKRMMAVILIGTFLQRFLVFVLTYVVYRGLGLFGVHIFDIVFVQASVYIAVDMLPIPGAQGITEAMYASVFGSIFTDRYLMASMCITRGISFYALMGIGLLVFFAVNIRGKKVS